MWKIKDWVNVDWCTVFIIDRPGGTEQQINIFYKEATWKGKSSYSGLFSNNFDKVVEERNKLYGIATIETKFYYLLKNKEK